MLILALPCAAATPVLHDDLAPDEAVARAAERLGRDPAELEPVPFADLRAAPPRLASGAPVAACAEPAPLAADAFEQRLKRAEGALLYGDFDAALARLDEARSAALCGPSVPAARLARVELVVGLVHEESGRPDDALARYAAAFGYDPDLAWHEAYPESRRGRFDQARAALDRRPVDLVVLPGAGATVDGRPVSDAVTGEHVVRAGDVAVRVTLDPLPDRLLLPAAYPDAGALAGMADPARRSELTALFAAHLGEARDAVVVSGDDVWTGLTGRSDFTHHPPPLVPQPTPVPEPVASAPARRSPAPLVIAAVSGGLGLAGGLVGLLEQGRANDLARAGAPWDAWPEQHGVYEDAKRNARLGYGALGVGALGAGVGLVWFTAR